MAFDPIPEYQITSDKVSIKDFYEYADEYVVRPPYQRKSVWSKKKKQALIDSLFRRYYVPRLVVRKVRMSDVDTRNEVVDGQQRISAVQDFFSNKFSLPKSLMDLVPDAVGKTYETLSSEIRRYIDKNLKFDVDYIHDIENPLDVEHQITATELFRLLQEGESLNAMEVAHAQLSSLSRNFIVKYSDDQNFDFDDYRPRDLNEFRHPFFDIIAVNNTRMKHLQLMARFTMLEIGEGSADLKGTAVSEFIDRHKDKDGINNMSFEDKAASKRVLKVLKFLNDSFRSSPHFSDEDTIPELKTEYFVLSVYLLASHLLNNYVVDDMTKGLFREFVFQFHARWKSFSEREDPEMLSFTNNRQQSEAEVAVRDQITRLSFFRWLSEQDKTLMTKDARRAFSEADRIALYREAEGICSLCIDEGLSVAEATVAWRRFHADHIVAHSKGGETSLDNGQLLCARHNLVKSGK